MKYDMSGAAIVSNFICGYAKNNGKKNILCFVPLAQNNISNNYK
jgi:leucyl aminopeptidase